MRLLRYGWISALGWGALACWVTFFTLLSQLDRRHLDPHRHPAMEVLSLAGFVLTLAWLRWRLRVFHWKVRSQRGTRAGRKLVSIGENSIGTKGTSNLTQKAEACPRLNSALPQFVLMAGKRHGAALAL